MKIQGNTFPKKQKEINQKIFPLKTHANLLLQKNLFPSMIIIVFVFIIGKTYFTIIFQFYFVRFSSHCIRKDVSCRVGGEK